MSDFWRLRKATVVDTMNGAVKVRIHQNDGTTDWIPSIDANVPNGTDGAVVRYSHEDSMFIPNGLDLSHVGHSHTWGEITGKPSLYTQAQVDDLLSFYRPAPVPVSGFNTVTTGAIDAWTTAMTHTLAMGAGTWRLAGTYGGTIWHSTGTGTDAQIRFRVNGVEVAEQGTQPSTFRVPITGDVDTWGVPHNAVITVQVRARLGGTITLRNPWIDLTAYRQS